MFNAGKILLFIVTMITSAAFLFFIPHFHMSLNLSSLISTHRIKSFLTLLSPIIFGAITAYIAYQQHCLAKTQANISRDQRDIAHNKQRMENYEILYTIYNENSNLLKYVLNLEYHLPRIDQFKIHIDGYKKLSDLVDANLSKEITDWSSNWLMKAKEIHDLLNACHLNKEKSKFMLDNETLKCISHILIKIEYLYNEKIISIDHQIRTGDRLFLLDWNKKACNLKDLFDIYTDNMKKYIDIRDIFEPRKLG